MINYPSYLNRKSLKPLRAEFLYAVMHMLLIDKNSTSKRDTNHAFQLGCSFVKCRIGVLNAYPYDKFNIGDDIVNEVNRLEAQEITDSKINY